jgi:hypothetical protein
LSDAQLQVQAFAAEEVGPLARVYYSRLPLLDAGFAVQGGLAGISHMQAQTGDVFPTGAVLDLLLSIPGVARAEVTRWSFTVHRSPVFEWWEVEGHLLGLLLGIKPALTLERDEIDCVSLATFDRSWVNELPTGQSSEMISKLIDAEGFMFGS